MKNQNLFLTGILTIALSCPAMADIAANANSAKCDNGTLETYQGESTLQAQWDANTINLKWYTDSSDNNGQEITPTNNAAATCTYDDAIVLPTNTITKEGYEFAGWRVRAAAAPSQPQQITFDLTTLFGPNNICMNGSEYGYQNDSTGQYGAYSKNTSTYGINGDQQWAVSFSYGKIKGEALCSSTNGTYAQTGTPTETGGGQYCWCKPTGFAEPNSSTYQNVSSSSWVFFNGIDDAGYCAYGCAASCAYYVSDNADFRRAVFGVTGADVCGGGSND